MGSGLPGLLLAGCTPDPEPAPPDPLQPLIEAATAQALLADAIAAAHPSLATTVGAVAADRRAHAERLTTEVRRATPSPAASATSATTTTSQLVPNDPAVARTAILEASLTAQRQAAELVVTLPRYRAGLVASVAGCCASHAVVLG